MILCTYDQSQSLNCACSYVAPEYASTGLLNEKSDVYSFGILLMEIISGRCPVDSSGSPVEVSISVWDSDLGYFSKFFFFFISIVPDFCNSGQL